MKTTLEMPDVLFRKAKALAATRGTTLKEIITQALERELARVESGAHKDPKEVLRTVKGVARANDRAWTSERDAVAAVRDQRRR